MDHVDQAIERCLTRGSKSLPELIDETGFSRATIFNHFPHLEGIISKDCVRARSRGRPKILYRLAEIPYGAKPQSGQHGLVSMSFLKLKHLCRFETAGVCGQLSQACKPQNCPLVIGGSYEICHATRPPPNIEFIGLLEFDHCQDRPPIFVPDFERNTGVKVRTDLISCKDAHYKLVNAHRLGAWPWDVVPLWAQYAMEMADRKWLADITDRCKEHFGPVQDDLPGGWDGFFEATRLGHRIYAVPDKIGGPLLMWNKKILQEMGLAPERPSEWYKIPNSIDEFLEYAKACTFVKDGVEYWGYVGAWGTSIADEAMCMHSQMFGGKLMDTTKNLPWGEPTMNSPECVAAVQWMVDLMNKHKVIDPASTTYNWCFDQFPPFFQGRAAFTITWPFAYRLAEDPTQSNMAGDTAFGLNFAKKTTATVDGSEFEGISAYAPHGVDWGWEWIKHKTSKETMEKQNKTDWMSIYSSQMAQSEVPFAKAVMESWKYPHSGFFTADQSAWSDILRDELHSAVRMEKTPQEAMDSCVKRINDLRSTYYHRNLQDPYAP